MFLPVGCAVLFGSGCASVLDYTPLNAPPFPVGPRSPDSVEIFSASMPPRPFVEIGQIKSEDSDAPPEVVMDRMRTLAAEKGCDGVILQGQTEEAATSGGLVALDVASILLGAASRRPPPVLADPTVPVEGFVGSCVVYTDAPMAERAPMPPEEASSAPPPPPSQE
jgi:hypothetical protein